MIESHYSSSLASVITKLVPKGGVVLDLGPMSSGTTDAFLQNKCRCYVEDLIEYLDDIHSTKCEPLEALEDHLLHKDPSIKFNVILCWDILNYLDIATITHLFELLKPHLQPGTILHFIKYSGKNIPSAPRKFSLQKDFTFELMTSKYLQNITSYQHSTINLLKYLGLFSILDTAMNQQGMQKDIVEYLLDYSPTKSKSVAHGITQSGLVSYFKTDKPQQTFCFNSIKSIFESHENIKKSSVLNLGNNDLNSLNFLDTYCSSLVSEDIHSSMAWHNKKLGNVTSNLNGFIINKAKNKKFDILLTWDLFNYCSFDQFKQLIDILSANMQDGALVHMLMHRNKKIPNTASNFEIISNESVAISGNLNCSKDHKLITLTELMRSLPNFKIKNHSNIRVNDDISYQELLLTFTPNRAY